MSIPDMPPVPARDNAPPPPRPGRRRLGRWLAWLAALLLLALAAVVLAAVLALRTEPGTRQLWSLATRLSAGTLSGKLEGGTVAHGLRLRDVVFASGETRVTVDRVEGDWSLGWSPARLHVNWLRIGAVTLRLPPSEPDSAPATLPKSLELPLAVDVDVLTLARLALLQGPPATPGEMVFSDLAGALHSDGQRHRLSIDRLVTPYGKLAASAQIAAQAPFALSGAALLEGSWQKESFDISANVHGSLAALRAEVDASGDRLRGRAEADLTPFGKVPFTHLLVNGEHINPQLFSPSALRANLSVHADLRPVDGAAASPDPAAAASAPAGVAASASAS
ncbi:translocation/assembly module TamB, partial [Cupriavidus sp. 2KB_15]